MNESESDILQIYMENRKYFNIFSSDQVDLILIGKYFANSSQSHSLSADVNKPLNVELQRKSTFIPFQRRFTFDAFCVCVITALSDPGNLS